MADLVIRGMEMPKDWDLWLCIDTGGTVYNVKPVITGTAQEVGTAIPLPEGHGRLIDADRLTKRLNNFVEWCRDDRRPGAFFVMDCPLPDSPTIVPAEGSVNDGN